MIVGLYGVGCFLVGFATGVAVLWYVINQKGES
jgi:hypothetical protein